MARRRPATARRFNPRPRMGGRASIQISRVALLAGAWIETLQRPAVCQALARGADLADFSVRKSGSALSETNQSSETEPVIRDFVDKFSDLSYCGRDFKRISCLP